MKTNQEITLGAGRIMKEVTIKVMNDDGKIGVQFFGSFFKKNTEIIVSIDGQKMEAKVLAVSKGKAIIKIKDLTVPINWNLAYNCNFGK